MPRLDLSPAELREYRPDLDEPADLDAFWAETLAESRALAEPPRVMPITTPLRTVDAYDVRFSGFGGDPIAAWLLLPAGGTGPLPGVVQFVGYGGGRGLPHEHLAWAASGWAHLVMDTRGQGSGWGAGGDTPDPHGSGPAAPGVMTRGITDPRDYYYRRVFTDAALAVDAVRSLDAVDASRVAVAGGSQGGGIAIAAAALSDGLVGALPEVPFLCDFPRAVGMTERDPYQEIVRYLAVHRDAVDRTFRTLSYFDGAVLATRATTDALFSVALMDPVCPPSTVFAARNRWGGTADIVEYAFNEHEGGGPEHWSRQAAWLADRI